MSPEVAAQEEELTDVILCYKAMGLSLDDGPAHIAQTYNDLTEGFRGNLASVDPTVREDARKNIALMREMYDKIKGSVTYNTIVRELEKNGRLAAEMKAAEAVKPKVVKLENHLTHCPSCRNVINIKSKVCPICKYRILTPLEKFVRRHLTTKKVVIAAVLLIVILAAVILSTNPGLIRTLARG